MNRPRILSSVDDLRGGRAVVILSGGRTAIRAPVGGQACGSLEQLVRADAVQTQLLADELGPARPTLLQQHDVRLLSHQESDQRRGRFADLLRVAAGGLLGSLGKEILRPWPA